MPGGRRVGVCGKKASLTIPAGRRRHQFFLIRPSLVCRVKEAAKTSATGVKLAAGGDLNLAISGGRLIGKVYDAQEASVLPDAAKASVAIVGLGHVGLPLAAAFAQTGSVAGYDINSQKIAALARGEDTAGHCGAEEIRHPQLKFHVSPDCLGEADVIIVCVPIEMRVDGKCHDDALISATRVVAANMKRGTVVVFESAVAPGTTENRCIPLLCEVSGRRLHTDFHVGYAPERTELGEPARRIGDIKKIVAGSSARRSPVSGPTVWPGGYRRRVPGCIDQRRRSRQGA